MDEYDRPSSSVLANGSMCRWGLNLQQDRSDRTCGDKRDEVVSHVATDRLELAGVSRRHGITFPSMV
ncbi:hypothetical protein [Streptomyces blastmyceticus]|uniref:hypothetical protein n=1 Tax=Streptomyces blastmyceticus TaxID=68180 RepID=UPI0031DD7016